MSDNLAKSSKVVFSIVIEHKVGAPQMLAKFKNGCIDQQIDNQLFNISVKINQTM